MLKLLFCLSSMGLVGCGMFAKDNKTSEPVKYEALKKQDAAYCDLSKPLYEKYEKTIEPRCDAALFTALHGLQCNYVTVSQFESVTEPGKLCRRPGCTCFPKQEGKPGSDSGFSKDMATGQQVYLSAYPDGPLAKRIQEYGADNKWFVCDASDPIGIASKCWMPPKIVYRWAQIEKKAADLATNQVDEPECNDVDPETKECRDELNLTGNTDFQAHLDILSVIVEHNLYKGISNSSLKTLEAQAKREPNNLLFQAMWARFGSGDGDAVAKALLEKFPADRLPTSSDWCTDYLYQRDEFRGAETNKDWLPCDKEGQTHPGTDYLLASWVLQMK